MRLVNDPVLIKLNLFIRVHMMFTEPVQERIYRTDEVVAMGSAYPLGNSREVMLDIESELSYWRVHYVSAPFHRTTRNYEQYRDTIKFGYDMFLLHSSSGLEDVLEELKRRYGYEQGTEALEWGVAEAVIRETWKRMSPDINQQSISSYGHR
jgi:hypothetical protein